MLIALIYDTYSAGLVQSLSALGEVRVFENQFRLRDYLLTDAPCDLVVSATDGALGMNVCTIARERRKNTPILWLTEQKEFEPQSKRTAVDAFMVKPVALCDVFATAKQLLENPPKVIPAAEPVWEYPAPRPDHVRLPTPPPREKDPRRTDSRTLWAWGQSV